MKDDQIKVNYQYYIQKFNLYIILPKIIFYISLGFAAFLFLVSLINFAPIIEYYPEYFIFILLGTGIFVGLAFLNRFLVEILISPTIIITLSQIRSIENHYDSSSSKEKSISKKDLRDIL